MAQQFNYDSEDKGIVYMGDKVDGDTVITRSVKVTRIDGDLFEAVHEENDAVVETVRGTYKDLADKGEKWSQFGLK